MLLLLLGVGPVLGSPFDQVPQGDPAYRDARLLAQRGIIDSRSADDFSGSALLTRYDFTLSMVRPMAALETLVRDGRPGAAIEPVARLSADDRAGVGAALTRLLDEFKDVLSLLGKDVSDAVKGARLIADDDYPSRIASTPGVAAGISFETARTRVGVTYRATEGEAAALPAVPLGGLNDAAVSGLAISRLPAGRATPEVGASERIASADVSLRRLRGSVQYGVTDNLFLELAYEAMVRQGKDTVLLDTASLSTLGVGYRLSPSASLSLSYHLINYADYTASGARLADRMAETQLTVRF